MPLQHTPFGFGPPGHVMIQGTVSFHAFSPWQRALAARELLFYDHEWAALAGARRTDGVIVRKPRDV